jgi:uncharacterized protein (TIGR02300 family)
MAKVQWGQKHVCLECQAAFYDMRRRPIACPKCGKTHQPVALLKSDGRLPRKSRIRPTLGPGTTPAEPEEAPAEAPESEISTTDDAVIESEDAEEVEPVGGGREY